MKHDSTMKLVDLLQKSSEDDLYILMEYNFGKGCTKVEIEELVRKLRYNGSNNIAYLYRKFEGVEYIEIVQNVAKKMKVKYSVDEDEEDIEGKILVKVLEKWLEKATEEEKKEIEELFKAGGINNIDFKNGIPVAALIPKLGGAIFFQLSAILANAVARQLLGHGIKIAMNQVFSRGIGFLLGPIGWAISGLLITVDLAGPAYRKTIPTVLQISYMRQKAKLKDLEWGEDEC